MAGGWRILADPRFHLVRLVQSCSLGKVVGMDQERSNQLPPKKLP